jgi:hypothetical protein
MNNNPYGSKTHLGGIDFETVRQFIQCDVNLRNGVNIGDGNMLTQSERDFLRKRGMDPHNIDNISEYTRLRSLALYDIEQRKKPVGEVVPEIKRKEMKNIGEYLVVNDRLNNKWLLHGFIGEPILDVFTPISYGRYVNRHAKVMDILTVSEYKLLISGDPLAFDSETMKKYFSIIRKLMKSGIYDDSEDVNENIPDKDTKETDIGSLLDSIFKIGNSKPDICQNVPIYAVKEEVQENTPFGEIKMDKYVFKAYDENGNEIPDYPFLPQTPIIEHDENKGIVITADGRQFPIKFY